MPCLRNPRHEKFASLIATGINPTEAYLSLGYSKNGARGAAGNLRARQDVSFRIDELVSQANENKVARAEFDRERVLNRLDVLSRKAEADGQLSVAVRCEELLGRHAGMFIDRSVSAVWNGDPATLTTDQLAQLILALEAGKEYADKGPIRIEQKGTPQDSGKAVVIDVQAEPEGLELDTPPESPPDAEEPLQ